MLLQMPNIETLCGSVVEVARQHCPSLLSQAQKKFKEALVVFHSCHKLYDANVLTDIQITGLGKRYTCANYET